MVLVAFVCNFDTHGSLICFFLFLGQRRCGNGLACNMFYMGKWRADLFLNWDCCYFNAWVLAPTKCHAWNHVVERIYQFLQDSLRMLVPWRRVPWSPTFDLQRSTWWTVWFSSNMGQICKQFPWTKSSLDAQLSGFHRFEIQKACVLQICFCNIPLFGLSTSWFPVPFSMFVSLFAFSG